MGKIKLLVIAILLIASNNVIAQSSDVFTDRVITSARIFANVTVITTDGRVENPDNCELTDFYILTSSPGNQQLGTAGTFNSRNASASVSDAVLLRLRLESIPIDFRLQECAFGRPIVRWIGF